MSDMWFNNVSYLHLRYKIVLLVTFSNYEYITANCSHRSECIYTPGNTSTDPDETTSHNQIWWNPPPLNHFQLFPPLTADDFFSPPKHFYVTLLSPPPPPSHNCFYSSLPSHNFLPGCNGSEVGGLCCETFLAEREKNVRVWGYMKDRCGPVSPWVTCGSGRSCSNHLL